MLRKEWSYSLKPDIEAFMLISHRFKFIFIHIPKTGGTSVQLALKPFADDGEEYGLNSHATALDAQRALPEIFNSYFKFAFVRNPWDLEVSMYQYKKDWFRRGHETVRWNKEISFEEFLEERAKRRPIQGDQCQFIHDYHGRCLVDFVGRFEFLARDFLLVARLMGLIGELPRSNASDRDPEYQGYYNPDTEELVRHISAPEIKAFGYTFHDAMPRSAPLPVNPLLEKCQWNYAHSQT